MTTKVRDNIITSQNFASIYWRESSNCWNIELKATDANITSVTINKLALSDWAITPINSDFINIDGTTITKNSSGVLSAAQQVTGTNDGTNWTSLTIGSDTYAIPTGGGGSSITLVGTTGSESISDGTTTLNVMTRDTAQTITGSKTFLSGSGITLKYYQNSTEYSVVSPAMFLVYDSNNVVARLANNRTDLNTYQITLQPNGGYLYINNIPTADPQVAGAVWNDNGTLKVSSGI